MTRMEKPSAFSRRALLKGAVVISVGAPLSLDTLMSMNAAQAQGTKPPLMPDTTACTVKASLFAGRGARV